MRVVVRAAAAAAFAALGLASSLVPAAAAVSPSPLTMRLSVAPDPNRAGYLVLTSQVQGGAVPGGASVAFFVVTTEFGSEMEVPIGTADVPKTGAASVGYRPTWNGDEKFVAHLSGGTAAAATATYTVTGAAPGPYHAVANEPRPFGSIGPIFLAVLLTAVALVWLTLLGTVARVAYRLPRLV